MHLLLYNHYNFPVFGTESLPSTITVTATRIVKHETFHGSVLPVSLLSLSSDSFFICLSVTSFFFLLKGSVLAARNGCRQLSLSNQEREKRNIATQSVAVSLLFLELWNSNFCSKSGEGKKRPCLPVESERQTDRVHESRGWSMNSLKWCPKEDVCNEKEKKKPEDTTFCFRDWVEKKEQQQKENSPMSGPWLSLSLTSVVCIPYSLVSLSPLLIVLRAIAINSYEEKEAEKSESDWMLSALRARYPITYNSSVSNDFPYAIPVFIRGTGIAAQRQPKEREKRNSSGKSTEGWMMQQQTSSDEKFIHGANNINKKKENEENEG